VAALAETTEIGLNVDKFTSIEGILCTTGIYELPVLLKSSQI
jgi:hypothetical protein